MKDKKITELDLKKNLFAPEDTESTIPTINIDEHHIFITDYDDTNKTKGDKLIYSWKLREMYPCELFEVVRDKGMKTYKVVVDHFQKKYLVLHKLPQEMFYMAYYLNEVL